MSVYKISIRWLDAYDPFWTCRILSLKVGTLTILLCLCNAFLKAPQVPMLYMLTTIIGTVASEALPLRSTRQKLLVLFGVMLLLSTTGMLFSLFSYFKAGLFVLIMAFTYFAFRFFMTNPKAAVVPSLMILWAVLQLGGGAPTDLNAVANSYLFYFEFALMGAITIVFFPDFTPNVFKSGLIRMMERDIKSLGETSFKNSDPLVLSALHILHSKLPFLPAAYTALYESVIHFQNAFVRSPALSDADKALTKLVLSEFIQAIKDEKAFTLTTDLSTKLKNMNAGAYEAILQLAEGYNPCKA